MKIAQSLHQLALGLRLFGCCNASLNGREGYFPILRSELFCFVSRVPIPASYPIHENLLLSDSLNTRPPRTSILFVYLVRTFVIRSGNRVRIEIPRGNLAENLPRCILNRRN